jgi:UDP-N-acetylmuramate dehydrogenase
MKILENFDLTNYNSYRIQSKCRVAYFPTCAEDFIKIYSNHKQDEIVTIGGGWNIILSKAYYEKAFLIVGDSFSSIKKIGDDVIECESGANTKNFSEFALANALSGVEIFYDIPSSIGGAVVMNAGASGEEIKDVLIKVSYLDLQDMQTKEIENKDIGFHYRNSFFQKNTDKIVLKAWFQLRVGDPTSISQKMEHIKEARWAKQPKNLPNAGSVFKRPKGYYVGAIIDELELKGYTVGGAQISKKHGGFIVNFNEAKGQDIIDIIKHVQQLTKQKFNVDLEVEQRII